MLHWINWMANDVSTSPIAAIHSRVDVVRFVPKSVYSSRYACKLQCDWNCISPNDKCPPPSAAAAAAITAITATNFVNNKPNHESLYSYLCVETFFSLPRISLILHVLAKLLEANSCHHYKFCCFSAVESFCFHYSEHNFSIPFRVAAHQQHKSFSQFSELARTYRYTQSTN